MNKMGLFRVTSTINNLSHGGEIYKGVEISWFVVYRDGSDTTHEQIIKNYTKNLDNSQYISESNLYELFTEKEADALKRYLLRVHKQGCKIKEADLSLEVYTLGYGNKILGSREGYYRLDNEDDYDLPFIVWGYYDISHGSDISWPTYEMRLIERALNKSGIHTTREQLRSLIENLKSEGLIIDRGTEKERIKRTKSHLKTKYIDPWIRNKGIILSIIISLVLVVVFVLLFLNNRWEPIEIISKLKPEAVYSKDSKEVESGTNIGREVNKREMTQENTEKIPEIHSDKKDVVSPKKRYLVVISSANIREGPAISFPVLSMAKKGDIVERLDDKRYWVKIKTQYGMVGWISKELLEEVAKNNM